MNRLSTAALLLLVASGALAQQPYTEKVDVTIVNVDVTVTSHGAPARGLTKDDFELLEDGVPQPITHFYAIEGPQRAPSSAVATTTNAQEPSDAPADPRFRRKVLVVFDARHLSVHSRDLALAQLTASIDRAFASGSYEWSVALIGNGAHLLLAPTADKEQIHEALAKIKAASAGGALREVFGADDRLARPDHETVATEDDSPQPASRKAPMEVVLRPLLTRANAFVNVHDSGSTYGAIRDITRAFANTEGRKIVLLVSGGLPDTETPLESIDRPLAAQQHASATALRDWLIREANVSGVTMYVLNPEGLIPNNVGADQRTGGTGSGTLPGVASGSLYWLASETGGKVFGGNFIDKSLAEFDEVSSNYYSLAFRPSHGDDAKYHRISVRLKQPGRYTLSYRTGYSTMPIDARLDRVMTSMMATSMQNATIPLTVWTGLAEHDEKSDALLVPIRISVPAKELQFVPAGDGLVARVDLWLSIFDRDNRLVTKFRTLREAHAKPGSESQGSFIEERALRLRRGQPYRIVVALHDQLSDAVGLKTTSVRPIVAR